MRSVRLSWIVAVLAFSLCGTAVEARAQAGGGAADAAKAFLDQVDQGNFDASWDDASSSLKSQAKRESWGQLVGSVRKKFGKLDSRTFESEQTVNNLAGAPDGQYVLLTYRSSFSNVKAAHETLALAKDEDGKWRIFRYSVQKRR